MEHFKENNASILNVYTDYLKPNGDRFRLGETSKANTVCAVFITFESMKTKEFFESLLSQSMTKCFRLAQHNNDQQPQSFHQEIYESNESYIPQELNLLEIPTIQEQLEV